MILPALALLAFGVGDLLRLAPGKVRFRTAIAIIGTLVATWGTARLSGMDWCSVTLTTIVALPAVFWLLVDWSSGSQRRCVWALLLPAVALVGTVAASGSAGPVEGSLQDWYENLPLSFVASGLVSTDQFVLGVGAFFFLFATSNRIVVLVLAAAKDGIETDEKPEPLKGGRFLGPMERLIIVASILSGNLAGAGFVVAAKGLLRFPEISRENSKAKIDGLTEYFLVGTFTSVIVAAVIALLLLAAS